MIRPWTNREVRQVMELRARGMTLKEIGKTIDRSPSAVAMRCSLLGIQRRKARVAPSMFRDIVKMEINHASISEYYALGWRFVGFKGDLYTFQWGGKGPARYPDRVLAEAA